MKRNLLKSVNKFLVKDSFYPKHVKKKDDNVGDEVENDIIWKEKPPIDNKSTELVHVEILETMLDKYENQFTKDDKVITNKDDHIIYEECKFPPEKKVSEKHGAKIPPAPKLPSFSTLLNKKKNQIFKRNKKVDNNDEDDDGDFDEPLYDNEIPRFDESFNDHEDIDDLDESYDIQENHDLEDYQYNTKKKSSKKGKKRSLSRHLSMTNLIVKPTNTLLAKGKAMKASKNKNNNKTLPLPVYSKMKPKPVSNIIFLLNLDNLRSK